MAEKRYIGAATVSASAGGGVGYAAAKILVWAAAQLGVDATPIEDALGLVLTVGGGVLGGLLVRTGGTGKRVAESG